jgi:glycerophosphoryl diester phosphodiesterase
MKHDVLTTKDAGKDNQGIPDEDVLAFANAEKRIVITFNYQHFKRLHRLFPKHSGIIICTEDKDLPALAERIHAAIEAAGGNLDNQLIRINRPNLSQKNA